MPIETSLLRFTPVETDHCSLCRHPMSAKYPASRPMMRGMVQRRKYKGWLWWKRRQHYCAVICWGCKEIIAWESPEGWMNNSLDIPLELVE